MQTKTLSDILTQRLAIAGSGAIACGLAATAARHGPVLLWARSDESAQRAQEEVARVCGRLTGEVNAAQVSVVTTSEELAGATASSSRPSSRTTTSRPRCWWPTRAPRPTEAVLATTTSSLSVADLAQASGHPEPIRRPARLQPGPADEARRARLPRGRHRAHPRAGAGAVRGAGQDRGRGPRRPRLRGQPAAVPIPVQRRRPDAGHRHGRGRRGCLHDARRRATRWARSRCWTWSASTSRSPIGEAIGEPVPMGITELVATGALGRKSGRGFHDYGTSCTHGTLRT